MYKHLIRPFFFLFNPEKIHNFTMWVLRFYQTIRIFNPLFRLLYQVKDKKFEREVFGIKFPTLSDLPPVSTKTVRRLIC